MIRLDRTGVKVFATWASLVERAFPDVNAFWEKAEAFEKLDLDHPDRRAGFRTYASAVLPKGRKGNDFKALWGRAKRALAAMSYQKCSYCETPINAERSAAVEHFKPSRFSRLSPTIGRTTSWAAGDVTARNLTSGPLAGRSTRGLTKATPPRCLSSWKIAR